MPGLVAEYLGAARGWFNAFVIATSMLLGKFKLLFNLCLVIAF